MKEFSTIKEFLKYCELEREDFKACLLCNKHEYADIKARLVCTKGTRECDFGLFKGEDICWEDLKEFLHCLKYQKEIDEHFGHTQELYGLKMSTTSKEEYRVRLGYANYNGVKIDVLIEELEKYLKKFKKKQLTRYKNNFIL